MAIYECGRQQCNKELTHRLMSAKYIATMGILQLRLLVEPTDACSYTFRSGTAILRLIRGYHSHGYRHITVIVTGAHGHGYGCSSATATGVYCVYIWLGYEMLQVYYVILILCILYFYIILQSTHGITHRECTNTYS